MKNDKRAIVMALLVSTVVSPVGKEALANEATETEITEPMQNGSGEENTDISDKDANIGSNGTEEEKETAQTEEAPAPKAQLFSARAAAPAEKEVVKQYGLSFTSPGDEFESVEFYKITPDGTKVDMKLGRITNMVNSNDKLYAKIVMKPGYELGSTWIDFLSKNDFTVKEEGSGDSKHLVYTLDGFSLPGGDTIYVSKTFKFQANQLPKQPEPPKPPVEKVQTYKLDVSRMGEAESFSFTATNPDDSTKTKTINSLGAINDIPEGWILKGEIVMPKNKYLMNTQSMEINIPSKTQSPKTELQMEVIKNEVNDGKVKYTFDNHVVDSNIWLATGHVTAFNHVTYDVNGGVWTDTTLQEQEGLLRWKELNSNGDEIYQAFIMPNESVYKPSDPTKKGYRFVGWRSSSDIGKPNGTQSVRMENYDFAEKDVNTTADYVLAGIVYLTAQWEANVPEFEPKTVTIVEGENFDPKELIDGEIKYNDDEVNTDARKVDYEYPENYDPKTPGEYKIKITVTNGVGGKTTKEGTLIVKRKWTPIEPVPTLEIPDKTIKVGDDFRVEDMVPENEKGKVTIETPEGFDKNKPGKYEIKFTKTNEKGAKITKTATLTVLGNLTPLIEAKLEVKDIEIWEGDKADLESMIQNHSEGNVEIIKPDNYDPNKAGTYEITFKLKADNGMTVTKKANLVVKPLKHKVVYRTEEPFEIEVQFDPNVKAGEVETIQEGIVGIKETTKIITFKNGVASEKVTEEVIQTKQNKIIKVGTKPSELEDLKEYGVVIVNYVDEAGLPIKSSMVNAVKLFGKNYDTTINKPATIEFNGKTYELVKVKDGDKETGTIDKALTQVTYIYKLKKDPTDPTDPTKPTDPTDPTKPGEDDPTDPEKPGEEEPENPDKPGEDKPEKPGTPDKPEKPEEPGTPDKPEEPEEPGTPDKPEKPENPETPGERPEIPEKPETPENPEVPETPEKPQAPNEERPETPATPETPDVKEEPESPAQAEIEKNVAKKSTNPKTGIGSVAPIITSMGISIAGLLAAKKKKEDEE